MKVALPRQASCIGRIGLNGEARLHRPHVRLIIIDLDADGPRRFGCHLLKANLPLAGTLTWSQQINDRRRTTAHCSLNTRATAPSGPARLKLVAFDDQPWELYDISKDRTEQHDLSKSRPDMVEKLATAWDKWAAENNVTPLPRDLGVKYLKPD